MRKTEEIPKKKVPSSGSLISNTIARQAIRRILTCISLSGHYDIQADFYENIKDRLLNCKVVLSGRKFTATKFKNLKFKIEKGEDSYTITGTFKKQFYDIVL